MDYFQLSRLKRVLELLSLPEQSVTKARTTEMWTHEKNTIFLRKMPIISAGIQEEKNPKPTNQETYKQTPQKTQTAKKILVHPSSVPWIKWQISWENPNSNWFQLSVVLFVFFTRKSAFQPFPFGCCMRHLPLGCFVSRCIRDLCTISVFGLKSFHPFLVPHNNRSQKQK